MNHEGTTIKSLNHYLDLDIFRTSLPTDEFEILQGKNQLQESSDKSRQR